MALKLYGGAISPFTMRVVIQIRAKGLDIPMTDPPGGLHSETYRTLNPVDKIPALDVDGTVIPESAVIADFLEQRFPEPALTLSDDVMQARVGLIARLSDLYVMNAMLPLFGQLDPSTRDAAIVENTIGAVTKGLGFLESYVAPKAYATADRFTLADCAAAPILFYADRFLPLFGATDPFAPYPNVSAYWAQVGETSAVAQSLEEMRQALDALSG